METKMTRSITEILEEMEGRARKAEMIGSDDFGHSVSEMQEWCESELSNICCEVIYPLIDTLRKAIAQRDYHIRQTDFHHYTEIDATRNEYDAELAAILEKK